MQYSYSLWLKFATQYYINEYAIAQALWPNLQIYLHAKEYSGCYPQYKKS